MRFQEVSPSEDSPSLDVKLGKNQADTREDSSITSPTWPKLRRPACRVNLLAPAHGHRAEAGLQARWLLHAGGSTFRIDDQWPGMAGRLFVKILLPQEDARVLRTVGGAWHEFEADGVNYGPTEETCTKRQKDHKAHDRENRIGLEGWRIERPGQVGTRVTVGTMIYEVAFATAGPLGGHIKISQRAHAVLDRAFATGVEDNYKKWRDDPRYKTWLTRQEYKNFIGAREVEQP